MARNVGTVARGIRCPIIRQGDDLAKIVVDSVLEGVYSKNLPKQMCCFFFFQG